MKRFPSSSCAIFRNLLPALCCAAFFVGCGAQERDWVTYDEINGTEQHNHETTETPAASASPKASAGRITWEKPASWNEQRGAGMRLATFTIGEGARTGLCTIVSLSGMAGGIEANVRRWMGQLNLETPGEEEFAAFLRRQTAFKTAGGFDGVAVDLTEIGNPAPADSSMLAAIITAGDASLFVKLTGAVEVLRAEKQAFIQLCKSVARSE